MEGKKIHGAWSEIEEGQKEAKESAREEGGRDSESGGERDALLVAACIACQPHSAPSRRERGNRRNRLQGMDSEGLGGRTAREPRTEAPGREEYILAQARTTIAS